MRLTTVSIVAGLLLCSIGCTCPVGADRSTTRANTPISRAGTTTRSSGGEIRVESARFGRDDSWEDVTKQVRSLIKGDTIEFPRNMYETFGVDPMPGRMKYVEMVLIVDGQVLEMTLGDSLHVTPLRLRAGGGGTRK